MPANTEAQEKRKQNARSSAVTATVMRLAAAALALWLWRRYGGGTLSTVILLGCALYNIGTIIPVWILLKIRLKEIEGGEEDAAVQY